MENMLLLVLCLPRNVEVRAWRSVETGHGQAKETV